MILETLAEKIHTEYPSIHIILGFSNIERSDIPSFPALVIYGRQVILDRDIRKSVCEMSYIVENSEKVEVETGYTKYSGFSEITSFIDGFLEKLVKMKLGSAIIRLSDCQIVYDLDFPLFTAKIVFFIDEKVDYYR